MGRFSGRTGKESFFMTKKKRSIIALTAILAALVVAGVVCWIVFGPKGNAGVKTIKVVVTHADESKKTVNIKTEAEFLRGALDEKKLVAGNESTYGLYILTVDGETADESKQQWWCITKGGETVMTGVDTTPIADGDTFEITLKTGW